MGLLYQRKEDLSGSLVKKYRIVHLAEVFSNFHHHCETYIDDDRGTEGYKGTVNEE